MLVMTTDDTQLYIWNKEDLTQGYCTADQKYWICEECFNDFKEMFKFEVE